MRHYKKGERVRLVVIVVAERKRGNGAYVIRTAVKVWKKSATEQRALERKLPMRLQEPVHLGKGSRWRKRG